MSTAELLEVCNALTPHAVSQLRSLAEEYEAKGDGSDGMSDLDFEEYGTKCQGMCVYIVVVVVVVVGGGDDEEDKGVSRCYLSNVGGDDQGGNRKNDSPSDIFLVLVPILASLI